MILHDCRLMHDHDVPWRGTGCCIYSQHRSFPRSDRNQQTFTIPCVLTMAAIEWGSSGCPWISKKSEDITDYITEITEDITDITDYSFSHIKGIKQTCIVFNFKQSQLTIQVHIHAYINWLSYQPDTR